MNQIDAKAFEYAKSYQITVDGIRLTNSYREPNSSSSISAYGHYYTNGIIEPDLAIEYFEQAPQK